jgi:hypothetical protein
LGRLPRKRVADIARVDVGLASAAGKLAEAQLHVLQASQARDRAENNGGGAAGGCRRRRLLLLRW